MVAQQEEAKGRRFFNALITRSNPFTLIIIGINVGVFFLEWLAGGMGATEADPVTLAAFGAKVNSLIAREHQYWRLITMMFLHIGFLHLLLNNYALWIIGMEIERIYGSARFVILYLLTGLVGSVASYFSSDNLSAGASGAIFGLFGVMATFAFRYRREIPEQLSREIKRRVIPIIAINLAFGFSVSIIDNAAHIGGLVSGILLALVIPYKRPQERVTAGVWRAIQILLMGVVLYSFISAFANYNGPKLSFDNLAMNPSERAKDYDDRMTAANEALVETFNSFEKVLQERDAGADTKPALEAAERGIEQIKDLPRTNNEHFDRQRDQMLELLIKQKELIEQFNQMKSKDWTRIEEAEERLTKQAEDYGLVTRDQKHQKEQGD